MNDLSENTTDDTEIETSVEEVEVTNESVDEVVAENDTETGFDLQNVAKQYFGPENLDAASDAINVILGDENERALLVNFNFDPSNPETVAEGFGLAIVPISARIEGKQVIQSISVAAIPDFTTIAASDNGEQYIRDMVANACMAKVANNSRVRTDGTAGTMPVTLTDFMENQRGKGEGLKAFSAVSADMVKALRKKGLTLMTAAILRNCLQSAQFALEQFEKITEEQWLKITDTMIAMATKEGHDCTIYQSWKDTRNETTIEIADTLDLDGLDDLI